MPVSFSEGLTGEGILSAACGDPYKKAEVLQFALVGTEGSGRDFTTKIPRIVPQHNGFVNTVIEAYNEHHAVVIRPDDVWLATLSQFNFFVNANAELLRVSFVAHEGKQELTIVADGSRDTLDFGEMSRQMVDLVEKKVIDPGPTLRAWALPAFTTTTTNDVTYGFEGMRCGIPRVMLEGERSDWADILGRFEKLKEYDIETIAWYHLLRPVLARFVAVFDAPENEESLEFWGKTDP
ncbi:hypothetical protein DFH07DRAFT_948021 [Mycena maculata]|uniref:Uncharacterized protein n=1 Tax=Mycena maculata TaxID=230809 RepID=A0AAD7KG46_9AGAR|nr:hypothetical protein DFH07DRAFT_948021 [Mycena maculata]